MLSPSAIIFLRSSPHAINGNDLAMHVHIPAWARIGAALINVIYNPFHFPQIQRRAVVESPGALPGAGVLFKQADPNFTPRPSRSRPLPAAEPRSRLKPHGPELALLTGMVAAFAAVVMSCEYSFGPAHYACGCFDLCRSFFSAWGQRQGSWLALDPKALLAQKPPATCITSCVVAAAACDRRNRTRDGVSLVVALGNAG